MGHFCTPIHIYFSDEFVATLTSDPWMLTRIAQGKGFLFIVVTGLLLYLLISRTVGKIRLAENEALASRNFMDSLIEGTTDVVFAKDTTGRYLLGNAAMVRITGKSVAEIIGNDDTLLFPPAEAAALMACDKRIMENGQVITFEEQKTIADGSRRTFLITKGPLRSLSGAVTGIFGISRDITERKNMEKALLESQTMLQRAETMAHIGHLRVNLVNHELFCSEELGRIVGAVNGEELTTDNCLQLVHPDDVNELSRHYEAIVMKGPQQLTFRIIRPDGELRHVTGFGELICDTGGSPKELFGTIMDVTGLCSKERELVNKNIELERFIYSVSHDLKGPLITVKTFLGYLEEDIRDNMSRVGTDMFYIRSAADKMGRLLDSLLEMSRIGRVDNPPVEIHWRELVDETLTSLAGAIAEHGVSVTVDDQDVSLFGERIRLGQIWQNLVENAVKFMGEQPAPQIKIGVGWRNDEPFFFVCDNGVGLEPGDQDRVFELFERLDPQKEGIGMGLALVKRIVEFNNGSITVESAGAGQGCCFRFTLPLAASKIPT